MADLEAPGSLETGVTEILVILPLRNDELLAFADEGKGEGWPYQKLKKSWTSLSEVVDEMFETCTVERSDMVKVAGEGKAGER